jgi:hypothetical protein
MILHQALFLLTNVLILNEKGICKFLSNKSKRTGLSAIYLNVSVNKSAISENDSSFFYQV